MYVQWKGGKVLKVKDDVEFYRNWWTFDSSARDLLESLLPQRFHTLGYSKMIRGSEFVYFPGELPIMLVAHVDTVFPEVPKTPVLDKKTCCLSAEEGIGADDRAGVAAIVEALRLTAKKPHVLFLDKEEEGCIGAKQAVKLLKAPEVNCIIELDRRGREDMVFYSCDNPEFEDYIKEFGFKFTYGSVTDISYLCPKWGIAGVNLSVGYYFPHAKTEYLNLEEWADTVKKLCKILRNPPKKKYEYIERKWSGYGFYTQYDTGKYSTNIKPFYSSLYLTITAYDLSKKFGGTSAEWEEFIDKHYSKLIHRLKIAAFDAILEFYVEGEDEVNFPPVENK